MDKLEANMIEVFTTVVREKFINKRILVIGDLMVDEYITGKVSRISPEAPVPVLNYLEKKLEAGGASNVARNIVGLGAKAIIMGVASDDEAGNWLREHLHNEEIDVNGIFKEEGRRTCVKTRYATRGQQLLRVDCEETHSITGRTQKEMLKYLNRVIKTIDAVIISDYQKGVLNNGGFVREIIEVCSANNILVAIDSKSRNIKCFENADFIKPNNLELEDAVGIKITNENGLEKAGRKYLAKSKAKALVVTRGASGISVFRNGTTREDYAASKTAEVFDVTGAGDTVISTITLGIISDLDIGEAVQLANLAASVAISQVGTVAVQGKDLIGRIYEEKNR